MSSDAQAHEGTASEQPAAPAPEPNAETVVPAIGERDSTVGSHQPEAFAAPVPPAGSAGDAAPVAATPPPSAGPVGSTPIAVQPGLGSAVSRAAQPGAGSAMPLASGPGAGGAMPVVVNTGAPAGSAPFGLRAERWLRAQQPFMYWRVLALGVVALVVAWFIIVTFEIGFLVPFYDLAFGLLIPATVALYWLEHGTPAVAWRNDLATAAAIGGGLGLIAAILLYSLLNLYIGNVAGNVVIVVVEEGLKVLAVAYFLTNARLRREIDGLALGIAAAVGFSALETAAYGYITFLQSNAYLPDESVFRVSIANMDHVLAYQLLMQVLATWVWTAIICAAIWRERRSATIASTQGLGVAVGIVLVLHLLWNFGFDGGWLFINLDRGYVPIFDLLVALAGAVVLSFFVREAQRQAQPGPRTTAPAPLSNALLAYILELPDQVRRTGL